MATIQFGGIAVNMYEADLGWADFGQALVAVVSGQIALGSFGAGQIVLNVTAPVGGAVSLHGRFNFSSEEAVRASTLTSFTYSNGSGGSVTIGGLNQSFNALIASLDTLGTTASNDTIIGYSLGDVLVGDTGNDRLLGGGGGDALFGSLGNDSLDGQFAGRDLLVGGTGNDTYTVGIAGVAADTQARDLVVEHADEGIDQALAYVSYALGDNVERLTLLGTENLSGTGNALNNVLIGNVGGNLLDGQGGVDSMTGGAGNDTYVVDAAGDTVSESIAGVAGGIDLVQSSASFVLGLNAEALTLTGSGNINATGNALANTLTGNDGDNRLDGMAGVDSMVGGLGDDTYVVDNLLDAVDETGGDGNDTVVINRSVNLATDFTDIENATLSGTGAFSATGTIGANRLIGNAGTNVLTGAGGDDYFDGGAGADSMIGGTGDDTYVIDSIGDRINDTAGVNTLRSSIGVNLNGAGFGAIAEVVLLGIAALTATGNARANVLIGNSGANRLDGGAGADTMTGAAGNDTYVMDEAGDSIVELINQGIDTILTSIGITLADNIEVLTLTTAGAALLTGNGIANTITGNAGADTLDGGAGSDTLKGSAGDDVYRVDSTTDVVTELLNQGTDRVEASASFVLGLNIEALTLTGSADINATGNALANTLTGNDGNNRLDGMAGADAMSGGLGNDTYIVDNIGDSVTDSGGSDTVVINRSVNLAIDFTGIENATLSGTGAFFATGTVGANRLIGNAGANTLTGAGGDDYFDGGAGADSMIGGAGDDTYVIDSIRDRITDTTGVNTLRSSINVDLNGADFGAIAEVVLLGTAALTAAGNADANALTGNGGANRLDGGAGGDTMTGAAGNDTYVVDDAGDTIVEQLNQGIDTVLTSVGITLADNVEILTLTAAGAASLIGNGIANTITGNIGDDTLDGGAGNDTLKGGAGDDTYLVDSTLDVVTETLAGVAGGSDLVQSSASFVLGLNIEALTLTGSADINATGNALANTLTGNFGDNRLDGAGGADNMIGGQGDDTYVVDNLLDAVDETGGGGSDTVVINRSVNLNDFTDIENATLSGTGAFAVTGTIGANRLIGNAGANVLTGADGDDYFDGAGGADSMIGGTGDDTYVIDSLRDRITDTAGTNTLLSSINIDLNGADFGAITEAVLLGAAALTATGNADANALTGNTGANRLDGGAGVDTMTGAAGNDTYVVDDAGDTIVEQLNQGIDTVLTSVGITLADNVEILTLTTIGAASLIGNGIANTITGNVGADTLDGGGGNDTLKGGAGDDTYLVDSTLDVVTETLAGVAGGSDLVQSSTSFVLGLNIEALTLTGSADINATGNALANTLTGNDGNNRLDGMAGADAMLGGLGDDTYVIDNLLDVADENGGGGSDTVVVTRSVDLFADFGIDIENVVLAGIGAFSAVGTNLDNYLTGNAAANTLTGADGNDVLDGKAGADTMLGGAGDDTYFVDSIRDRITDTEGANSLFSSVNVDLGGPDLGAVSDVILLGTAALFVLGSVRDDRITGNAGANTVIAAEGNDTLIGAAGDDLLLGGIGDDSMDGGDGNDELIGDSGNDLIAGGIGDDLLSGGRGNDTLEGDAGIDTLSGGSGDDVYLDVDALDIVTETADGGYDTVQSNASVTLGETVFSIEAIELLGTGNTSAIGSADDNRLQGNIGDNLLDGVGGNDTLIGDDGDDTLIGGDGNDSLDGGIGADSLVGCDGNDTYVWGDDPGDVVTELADDGIDTIRTSGTLVLDDFANIENAELTGAATANLTGNSGANRLTGNAGDNELLGFGGNDTLLGDAGDDRLDGGADNDSMDGGLGDDTYLVNAAGDTVSDILGGLDLVRTSVDFILAGGVEQAEALGSGDIALTGTGENNVLTGNDGDNRLDGGGGSDTLIGGDGNDTYALRLLGGGTVTIVENANEGIDTVRVYDGDVFLSGAFANIENAIIDPSTSTANAVSLTGNGADNRLEGSVGANGIDGGVGADTMIGGDGNDTYVIDNAGDEVVELADQGNDLLFVNRSIDLNTEFANIERFGLTGSANLTMTGNDADNRLIGNAGANRIDGGSGADFMAGDDGNDTYVVDDAGDEVAEGGTGVDLVEASVSYTLGNSLENLLLTGTDNLNGTGNVSNNVITGNAGNNLLDGGGFDDTLFGGDGNDTLTGGQGTDRLDGGSGDDVLTFDFSELFLDGGTGNDLMRVTGTGQPIRLGDAGAPGDAHRYQNIEIIDLTGSGNNSIADLTWLQVLDVSDDDRLIVDGNAGDGVVSETGQNWTQGADQTVGSNLYNAWTSNGATLLIDPDVTFTPL